MKTKILRQNFALNEKCPGKSFIDYPLPECAMISY